MPSNVRAGLAGAAVLLAVAVIAWATGLLGESAEDQVNAVADDFHGQLSADRLDAAMSHLDPTVAPVEVRGPSLMGGPGFTRVYGNGALPNLRRDAMRALAPVMGETFTELRRSVEMADDDEAASVALELLSTSRGTVRVELGVVRDGERWLVRKVAVSR